MALGVPFIQRENFALGGVRGRKAWKLRAWVLKANRSESKPESVGGRCSFTFSEPGSPTEEQGEQVI